MEFFFSDSAKLTAAYCGACFFAIIAAAGIDMWTGCDCARRRGEQIHSHKLRDTVSKVCDYWRLLALAMIADVLLNRLLGFPYLSVIVTVGVLAIEGRSVVENLRKSKSAAEDLPDTVARLLSALSRLDVEKLRKLGKDGKG